LRKKSGSSSPIKALEVVSQLYPAAVRKDTGRETQPALRSDVITEVLSTVLVMHSGGPMGNAVWLQILTGWGLAEIPAHCTILGGCTTSILSRKGEQAIANTITIEQAKGDIVTAFPQLSGMRVELLDEGYDFLVFEVGEGWLFRFPKHEQASIKLGMEGRLLPGLADWLSLPVPRYECVGQSNSGRAFAQYRKLPGISGDVVEVVDRDVVARQLGLFLGRLHAYPVDRAREAGVPEESNLVTGWRLRSLERLDRIAQSGVDLHELRSYLENENPLPFEGPARLVHNDLWAEHVLIDERSGCVSGIIDWADAVVSDPAVDFAGLFAWYGERWLGCVLDSYPGRRDSQIIARARYLAACLAIHSIILGQDLGRPRWIEAGEEALRWILSA